MVAPTAPKHGSTRQQVVRLVRQNPKISAADVGRQVGVSRARVSLILEEEGYTLRQEWRRTRRKKAGRSA